MVDGADVILGKKDQPQNRGLKAFKKARPKSDSNTYSRFDATKVLSEENKCSTEAFIKGFSSRRLAFVIPSYPVLSRLIPLKRKSYSVVLSPFHIVIRKCGMRRG